jgi:hypothetical protein
MPLTERSRLKASGSISLQSKIVGWLGSSTLGGSVSEALPDETNLNQLPNLIEE